MSTRNRGGKKAKRMKNGGNNSQAKRELLFKEEDQEYAQVTKMLGDGRVELHCYDNVVRMGHIRGKLKNRVWINVSDIVLVSLRGFDAQTADIFHKYTSEEARTLQAFEELPANAKINATAIDIDEGFGHDEEDGATDITFR